MENKAYMQQMGRMKSDHYKRLITLTVITLSGFHCTNISKPPEKKANSISKLPAIISASDRIKQIKIQFRIILSSKKIESIVDVYEIMRTLSYIFK